MPSQLDQFAGNGVMRFHLCHHDWATCPLGEPTSWPAPLRTAVAMMLDSALPMWVCWGTDLLLLYNDGYATILGAKHLKALSRPYADVWPEVWKYLEPVVNRAIAGESTFLEDTELILLRQGKPERTWFTYSISPLRDENGGVVGIYGTAIETTRHVLANQKRVAESEDLRQMFSKAPSFMAVVRGPEHCFEIVNQAFMQLIGHRPVLGKTVAQALPETVEQGFVALLDEVYRTGKVYTASGVKYEVQAVPDGGRSNRFLNFVYQPMTGPTGEVSGIFIEGVDVTEERRTTQALEALNADLERQVTERSQDRNALWTLSSDIMLRCNFDGVITATNPAWHDLLGWAEHELIGLNLFDLIHPDDIAHTIEGAQQLATVMAVTVGFPGQRVRMTI
jgi:PAS domain-containing protein